MTISPSYLDKIERIAPRLLTLGDVVIDRLVDRGDVLDDSDFSPEVKGRFGHFYAPFDWINDEADIVLIGITPGRSQAKSALKSLRGALRAGLPPAEAAKIAKQAASFDGEMRRIAAQLMNRFNLHRLFGLEDCSELFGGASRRAHYTSLLRYPVLHWQTKKKRNGSNQTGWFDFSGGNAAFTEPLLRRLVAEHFEIEIAQFRAAWQIPFGSVPATALAELATRGVVDSGRVLSGINHPSGTQRNRHNCQLNTSDDHSACGRSVGCETIRSRSSRLEKIVEGHLAVTSE